MKKTIYILLIFLVAYANTVFADEEDSLEIIGKEAPKFCLPEFSTNKLICLRYFCGEELKDPEVNNVKQPVILSFFAHWCSPCEKEIPVLQKLNTEFQDSVKIFLISTDRKKDKHRLNQFIEKMEISLPVLWDKYEVVARNYKIKILPTLFIIDRNGYIFTVKKGYSENFEENLREKIKQVISKI